MFALGLEEQEWSPQRLRAPFITAALKPPPIVVELVMG